MQILDYEAQPTAAEHVTDAAITTAIELLFLTKKGVATHLIGVTTYEGIVVLTGIIDNLLARERAEEIALAVRGVRGVVNELLIGTADVPDEELHRHVTTALANDPAASDYNVHCTAHDGVVTLTGTVQSWVEKQLAVRVVRGVQGVRGLVTEEVIIRWGEIHNSDDEITIQVRELLDWDIRVSNALVEIRTHEQVVYMSGTVGTAAEKAHVVAIAYQAGANHVEARDLLVAYWALNHELHRIKAAARSDEDIAKAVLDTFRFDPRVLSYQPIVLVHNGIVTLSGAVSNLRAKQEAERDASHVVGMWNVHNLLKVRTNRFIPDMHIGQTIREALARNPHVGGCEFSVYVRNGKTQLYGQVSIHFEQEQEQAGAVASGVNGVAEVDNWVSVPGSPGSDGFQPYAWKSTLPRPNPDFALAERIRIRLFWSASLYAQHIEVFTKKGCATLTGTVDTWLDREQATDAAYAAGATTVANDLVVWTPNKL